jgi:hypothetical protein
MAAIDPCLIRSTNACGELLVRLGVPVLDDYLRFVAARARPNTVLATAYDLAVFFRVVRTPPAEVTSADVLRFITAQRTGSDGFGLRVVADGVGLSARTVRRRLSSVSGLFAYLLARGDVTINPVPRGLPTRRERQRPRQGVPLVRTPRTLPQILAPAEVDRLLAALRTHRDRTQDPLGRWEVARCGRDRVPRRAGAGHVWWSGARRVGLGDASDGRRGRPWAVKAAQGALGRSRSHGCAGAWQRVDVVCVHRLAAVGAAQVDTADLAARVMAVEHWRAGLACEPFVPPAGHDHEQVDQLGTLLRQAVFMPRSPVVGPALEHALVDEVVQPLGQDLARDPEVGLDLLKPGEPGPHVTQDQR